MQQALLLNATYEPLKVVHWQKAITLWCQGKVEVIAVSRPRGEAVSFTFKLPSVIRLLRFVKIKRRFDYVPFSRANIYARDHHTCQYCSGRSRRRSSRLTTWCPSRKAAARTGKTSSPAVSAAIGSRVGARRQKPE